jgi:uncharacterized protein
MKNTLLILVGIIMIVSCSNQEVVTTVTSDELVLRNGVYYIPFTEQTFTGLLDSHYENGTLKNRYNYTSGVKNGLFEEYDENGQLRLRGISRRLSRCVSPEGVSNETFSLTSPECVNEYYYRKEGPFVEYYANGQPKSEVNYIIKDPMRNLTEAQKINQILRTLGSTPKKMLSIMEGPYVRYHKNGRLKKEGTYFDGKLNGMSKNYYANGRLREINTYYYGDLIHVGRYKENGQLSWVEAYTDGLKDGLFEEYYESGKLKLVKSYSDGQLDGLYKRFNEDGTLRKKAFYKLGKQYECEGECD